MNKDRAPVSFIVTKEHRRFVEFCEACRRYHYIGLCYGVPGVGKTLSARTYAHWDHVESLRARLLDPLPSLPEIAHSRTVFYTPPVVNSPNTLNREMTLLRRDLSTLVAAMGHVLESRDDYPLAFNVSDVTELVIVDEADRLRQAGLEQMRDIYDRDPIGLVLIGMPGIEKRLARYAQLYSRVGFVHHFKLLNHADLHLVLSYKWQELGLSLDLTDAADAETAAAILRATGGNFRLVERLFSQMQRIMEINELRTLTKDVVEAARELLVIGA